MTVGDRIRNTRIQKGMSQKELAEKLDITPQSIVQWENGARNPKPETLKKIAEALGVSYWRLAGDSDDPNNDIPAIQDPGFVANMILNDITATEVLAHYNGQQLTEMQKTELLNDLIDHRSKQFRISSFILHHEVSETKSDANPSLKQNDLILKEILRTINEMNLDGWIAVLNHVRELSKIPGYLNER